MLSIKLTNAMVKANGNSTFIISKLSSGKVNFGIELGISLTILMAFSPSPNPNNETAKIPNINAINWLAGDVEQISVRPNVSRASSFQMSQDQFRRIQYLSLFVLPEAIAIFGVVTWWLRRRSPGRTETTAG